VARSPRVPAPTTAARRPPDLEAALYLVSLLDPLLHDARRLQQHADLAQGGRHPDDELRIIDVALGQVAVQQVDAALAVRLVGGHVGEADPVVDSVSRTPDRRHHVIAGYNVANVRPDLEHAPEGLVARHQEVVALGRRPVLGVVDLLVRPVHPDPQDLYEHAASVRYILDARLR
jgi:hypothetical protein